MPNAHSRPSIADEDRREFLKLLGVGGGVAASGFTLDSIDAEPSRESSERLAEMGESIRADLDGSLDADLLGTGRAGIAEGATKVDGTGIPDDPSVDSFGRFTDPAWPLEEHLAEVGFFAAADRNLPVFTPDHVETTTKSLVHSDALSSLLGDVGLDADERTALLVDVVSNRDALAHWAPAQFYRDVDLDDDGDAIRPEAVPPLQRRAARGSLLWIDGLGRQLWQNEVLLTEEVVGDAEWDVRVMLGGFYVLASAAERLARDEIADEELTALVSGSTAIMISSQNRLATDAMYVTDEVRAPQGGV
ncbi:MAG: hypothetical protein ABEJ26_06365 [Halosimplex sp.]